MHSFVCAYNIIIIMCMYAHVYTGMSVYFYVCVRMYKLVEHFICILFHASSFSPASVVNESLPLFFFFFFFPSMVRCTHSRI